MKTPPSEDRHARVGIGVGVAADKHVYTDCPRRDDAMQLHIQGTPCADTDMWLR
jgi:hypothetical protein